MPICRWTCSCTYLYLHFYLYLLPWTGHEGVTDTELVSEDEDKTEMKAKDSNREKLYSSSSSNSSNSRCSVWPVGQAAGRREKGISIDKLSCLKNDSPKWDLNSRLATTIFMDGSYKQHTAELTISTITKV